MRSGVAVALPLTAMSSQFVIGSFEARFFLRTTRRGLPTIYRQASHKVLAHRPNSRLGAVSHADLAENVLDVLFYRLVANS
jgi:hypothetical protein